MPTPFSEEAGEEKTMESSFEKLLAKLAEAEIRFIVVGGLAVTLNGYVRLTEDVDFIVDTEKENVQSLIQCLGDFGEGFGGKLTPDDFSTEPGAIRVVEATEDCQMDIFTLIGGYPFEELIDQAETANIGTFEFRYASKQQLIEIKSTSQREKDKIDISAMKQLIEDPEALS
jgi:predicted nucleotidyltransferase